MPRTGASLTTSSFSEPLSWESELGLGIGFGLRLGLQLGLRLGLGLGLRLGLGWRGNGWISSSGHARLGTGLGSGSGLGSQTQA